MPSERCFSEAAEDAFYEKAPKRILASLIRGVPRDTRTLRHSNCPTLEFFESKMFVVLQMIGWNDCQSTPFRLLTYDGSTTHDQIERNIHLYIISYYASTTTPTCAHVLARERLAIDSSCW